ncbi:MAG: hypothetical protein V1915_00455 [Candidatus Bathyarchaeota archaeon]
MRSYIKIYGPPVSKAIKALEKIAVGTPEVCMMDTILQWDTPNTAEETSDYFQPYPIDKERCDKIISKSGEQLGDYDFFFEWFRRPSVDELNDLIEKIDDALALLGCKYTITTKAR